DGLHLDLVDLRRVQRERALDAHPERVLADGERLADARPLPLQDDALEDLDPLARALDDAELHANGVARLATGDLTHLAGLDRLDAGAHGKEGRAAAGMVDETRLANGHAAWRPVGREDLADQVVFGDRPPGARVARGAPVVVHHEVLPLGDLDRGDRAGIP